MQLGNRLVDVLTVQGVVMMAASVSQSGKTTVRKVVAAEVGAVYEDG